MAASKLKAFWDHPAGPKTNMFSFHFWAPTFKWVISIGNIADFTKPPEKVSYPQQTAVTASGLISVIWSRYSMVITPKNWKLFSVNVAMAGTGIYQISRKINLTDPKPADSSLQFIGTQSQLSFIVEHCQRLTAFIYDPQTDGISANV